MTTIAYRNGIMAADSLAVLFDFYCGRDEHKIQWTDTKDYEYLLGVTGAPFLARNYVAWLRTGAIVRERPDLGPDKDVSACVLVAARQKTDCKIALSFHTKHCIDNLDVEFWAIGSGRELALGAMAFGASAAEAVKAATQFDPYTGGEIKTLAFR